MRCFFLYILITFLSCGRKQKQQEISEHKPALSIKVKHSSVTELKKGNLKKLNNWTEYNSFEEFIQKFYNISPNNALSNASEVNDLAQKLNDSIRPVFLKNDAFKARTNLLLNETLRLNDMVSISSLKADEINPQIDKILRAFSSVNSKINMTLTKLRLEKELTDLNYDFTLNDSLISKQRI